MGVGSSRMLTPDKTVTFSPVNNALEILGDLVRLSRGDDSGVGIFPHVLLGRTSRPPVIRRRLLQERGKVRNTRWARETICITPSPFGTIGNNVLAGEFPNLAARVYGPLRDHLAEENTW